MIIDTETLFNHVNYFYLKNVKDKSHPGLPSILDFSFETKLEFLEDFRETYYPILKEVFK